MRILSKIFFFFLFAAVCLAQPTIIQGTITDKDFPTAPVNGVHVYAVGSSNDTILNTYTDAAGFYIDTAAVTSINEVNNNTPGSYKLYQNYPNPFNPHTKIRFDTKEAGTAILTIYDLNGEEIYKEEADVSPGSYEFDVKLNHLSSGIYLYMLEINGWASLKKLMMIKGYKSAGHVSASVSSINKVSSLPVRLYFFKDGYRIDQLDAVIQEGSINTVNYQIQQNWQSDTILFSTTQILEGLPAAAAHSAATVSAVSSVHKKHYCCKYYYIN